jgi:cytochrome c556
MKLREVSLAAAALVVVLGAAAATSQDKTALVTQRQEIMKNLWPNYYDTLAKAAKGDAAAFSAAPQKAREANEIVRNYHTFFPAGTGRDAVPQTRATPEVWSQRSEFEGALRTLADETAKLGDVAKAGDAEAYKTQFGNVMKACGACHGGPPKSGGKFRFEAS